MRKRGQFYLIAVILISAVLIGLLSTANYGKSEPRENEENFAQNIEIERGFLLDYFANSQLDENSLFNTSLNFSKNFVNKIGASRDTIFIFGNSSNLTFYGNKLSSSNISYDSSGSYVEISDNGEFLENVDPTNSNIKIALNNVEMNFTLYAGQNLYYVIKHINNEEVYILHG